MEFRAIGNLSLEECCESLGIHVEELPGIIDVLRSDPGRNQLVVERLVSIMDTLRMEYDKLETLEQLEGYMADDRYKIWSDDAQQRILSLTETRFFEQHNGSAAGCREYLQRYPDGIYVTEVLAAIEEMDLTAYESCERIDQYEAYLRLYPDGLKAEEARYEIQRLEEDEVYRKAIDIPGIKAYLAQYPEGRYVPEVNDRYSCIKRYRSRIVRSLCLLGSLLGCLFMLLFWYIFLRLQLNVFDLQEVIAQKDSLINYQRDSIDKFRDSTTYYLNSYNNLKNAVSKLTPIVVDKIEVGNWDKVARRMETDYGGKIYSSSTMYIKPRVYYHGFSKCSKKLLMKFFDSEGHLDSNEHSPEGYTYANTINLNNGYNYVDLFSWGNDIKGNWKAGKYRCEIWCDGICLGKKTFTIHK